MQQHSRLVANSLPADPLPDPGGRGQKVKVSTFFRTWSCCISNKLESRMQQQDSKSFAHRPPPDPGEWDQKVTIQLFHNMAMLHIKLNGITNAATW